MTLFTSCWSASCHWTDGFFFNTNPRKMVNGTAQWADRRKISNSEASLKLNSPVFSPTPVSSIRWWRRRGRKPFQWQTALYLDSSTVNGDHFAAPARRRGVAVIDRPELSGIRSYRNLRTTKITKETGEGGVTKRQRRREIRQADSLRLRPPRIKIEHTQWTFRSVVTRLGLSGC